VSPVAVYFDEVYMNFTLAQSFPLFDIERVEVLRGPGHAWGRIRPAVRSASSRESRTSTPTATASSRGKLQELGVQGAVGGTIIKTGRGPGVVLL